MHAINKIIKILIDDIKFFVDNLNDSQFIKDIYDVYNSVITSIQNIINNPLNYINYFQLNNHLILYIYKVIYIQNDNYFDDDHGYYALEKLTKNMYKLNKFAIELLNGNIDKDQIVDEINKSNIKDELDRLINTINDIVK